MRLLTAIPSIAAAILAASPFASAQNATTDPVGFQSANMVVGTNPIGLPLLNPDLVKTSVASLSGNTLTLSGVANVGSLLTAGEPYYLEVYSGTLKGDRFEVSTNATVSAANSSLVLDSASPFNTYSVGSIGTALDSQAVVIRKHVTLEQVQTMFNPALIGSNTASSADQISVFDPSSQNYVNYFLRSDNVTWRRVGTTTGANKLPIPPGSGIFLNKKTSATTLTQTGGVRVNDFALPYVVGNQLLAPGFPINYSPASLGGTAANGWTGSNTASNADQLAIFSAGSQNFTNYFLRADGVTWRQVGTTSNATLTDLVNSAGIYFAIRKTADASNVLVNPIPNN